jgi:hypothetical protein
MDLDLDLAQPLPGSINYVLAGNLVTPATPSQVTDILAIVPITPEMLKFAAIARHVPHSRLERGSAHGASFPRKRIHTVGTSLRCFEQRTLALEICRQSFPS